VIDQRLVLDLLHMIEVGAITLRAVGETAEEVYAGNVTYRTVPDGWTLVVFNDCNSWDYLDSVTAPDGRTLDFDQMMETMPELASYRPSKQVSALAYGIGEP
jgi:hypothetical protein